LLQKCHRLFLDCVDHELSSSVPETMRAFDVYSQIYCQKFNGQIESKDAEAHDARKELGVAKMLSDIHDAKYVSPLHTLEPYKSSSRRRSKDQEVHSVIWWVLFVLACILGFMYLIGMYFTYFDDPKEFYRQFSNQRRYTQISASMQRRKQEQQQQDAQLNEQFAAPT